ncbi:hypothetical protein BV898_09856 [Hypsibius exemplaris]|uniref:Uncharacterized protein n=1 Tax=Hypsibius exemplaris TaxID=2072580 RepID=A0A1W0WLC8_HYPEX|nr:hypothetical protein BV898_09856 [Hypsibius exemplaris]
MRKIRWFLFWLSLVIQAAPRRCSTSGNSTSSDIQLRDRSTAIGGVLIDNSAPFGGSVSDTAESRLTDTRQPTSQTNRRASASAGKSLDPYGDTVIMDDKPPRRPLPNQTSQQQRPYRPPLTTQNGRQTSDTTNQEDSLETLVCPTMTQTVYLRPKTVTRTVHVIRPTAGLAQAAGQSFDYVTVANPNAADNSQTVIASTSLPPCAGTRPSTEFRNFVYLSTQFVRSTLTEYATATRTVSISVDVYREPVTQYKTVYVSEAQPSVQYQRAASGSSGHSQSGSSGGYQEDMGSGSATVTVTQLQDCPILACDPSPISQPSSNHQITPSLRRKHLQPAQPALQVQYPASTADTPETYIQQVPQSPVAPVRRSDIRPTPVQRRCRLFSSPDMAFPEIVLPAASMVEASHEGLLPQEPQESLADGASARPDRRKRDVAPRTVVVPVTRGDLYRGDAHNVDYSIVDSASASTQQQMPDDSHVELVEDYAVDPVQPLPPEPPKLQARSEFQTEVVYHQPPPSSQQHSRRRSPQRELIPETDIVHSDWYPC